MQYANLLKALHSCFKNAIMCRIIFIIIRNEFEKLIQFFKKNESMSNKLKNRIDVRKNKKIIAKTKNTIHISKIQNQNNFKMLSKNRHYKMQLSKIEINRKNKIEKIFVIKNATKINILKMIAMTKSIKTKTIR